MKLRDENQKAKAKLKKNKTEFDICTTSISNLTVWTGEMKSCTRAFELLFVFFYSYRR